MTDLGLRNVDKSYASLRVLKGITHHIPSGTFFTLLGPSGCGKTTLLRVLAGFVAPSSGTVHFGSEDVTYAPTHRREIGMVFQDYALFPDKTVFENVSYGLRARKRPSAEIRLKVNAYLERVGLAGMGDRLPAALSGGQRQRVALARALVIEPRVLLMDEPLSNLDASLRIQMRDVIRSLQLETRTTTIFVTHDQEEALAMSDRIAVMKDGRIDQCGSPDEVYRTPKTAYVSTFVGSSNLLEARALEPDSDGVGAYEVNGSIVRGRRMAPADDNRYLMVARPENIGIRRATTPPLEGEVTGTIVSLQFQGYRTSYRVALRTDVEINVETFGEAAASHLSRGDDVIISFNDKCLFVPEASR